MKRRNILLAAALCAALLLSGCGSSAGTSATASDAFVQAPAEAGNSDMAASSGTWDESLTAQAAGSSANVSATADAAQSTEKTASSSPVYRDKDAKLIRTASVTVQTTEFEKSTAALDALVNTYGGYYESATVGNGGYTADSSSRYGYYTVRVPSEKYDAFMNSAGTLGHLSDKTEDTTDVGQAYYDTELHIKTLETKHARLLALMDKATKMEDIITIESALSDVEYELQQYQSDLSNYDSLIDYSTINITLNEVSAVTAESGVNASLGSRMSTAFSNGLTRFSLAMGDFAVWCAYHFAALVIVLLVAAAVIAVVCVKAGRRKKKASLTAVPPVEEKKPE